ncbi:motility associated factor glycosyltransferase family protein [Campylobacter coli]|nr:motility associated factor glycosyltransferase family protein [Campylobacter coli]
MNNELFLKNTQALFEVDQILAYELRRIKHCFNFALQGDNLENLNIIHLSSKESIYKNPYEELSNNLTFFKQEYSKYPTLFFYGLGSGAFYKALLTNQNHKQLIVFESELELFYLAFHLFDFSKDIRNERLILFYTPNLNTTQLNALLNHKKIKFSIKTYDFHIHSEFYLSHYKDIIQNLNQSLIEIIKFIVLAYGNDPKDSHIGIEHTLKNLNTLVYGSVFQHFLKYNRAKSKNAIIVSTGPSLTKQLPLLKEYASKATIFCADSSYPILARAGIKPDYVLSLERIAATSEFFNNDFKEFDKDILFIITSLTHENTLKYLEKNHRNYMLVLRPLLFSSHLKLDDFGYLGVGMSVANMAYELAAALRHENIILIGQDLAYDDLGHSHPKDHIYGEQGDKFQDKLSVRAYGGKGFVKTQLSWQLFRQSFEKDIPLVKEKLQITTYNCTEGGARIEGSIEKPFKELCETLLDANLEKPFKNNFKLEPKEAQKILEKTKKHLLNQVKSSKNLIEEIQNKLKTLPNILNEKDINLDFKKLKKLELDFQSLVTKMKSYGLMSELLQALVFHQECDLLKLKVQPCKNQEEEQKQILLCLKYHHEKFSELILYMQIQNELIEKYI